MTESNSTYSGPKRSVKSYLKKLFSIAGIIIAILLAVIVLVGLIPVSHDGLESIPNPSTSYEASIARFEQLLADEQGVVNDASRSLLLTHGEKTSRVYVLVHGTTNSPHQWQEFGNKLFDLGNNVVILRMPYHGLLSHKVSELTPLTAKDIREYSDQTVDIAAGLGDDVYVIGLSGGGTVASWMAQNRTEVIKTLLLSPFYGIGPVPTSLTPILINAFTRLPNIVLTSPGEMFRDWAYMGESTRGVAAFLLFGHEVLNQAMEGKVPQGPVFVVTTASDHTASNKATADLVDIWKAAGVETAAFEFSKSLDIPHNSIGPLEDPEKRQMAYDKILEYMEEQP